MDKKEHSDSSLDTIAEKDQILQSIFLSGKAVDASFLYRGEKATQLYEAVVHDPAYFPYQSGLDLISHYRSQLQKYVGRKLIDYGSGTGEKAVSLLKSIGKYVQYIPYDYSYEMTEVARSAVGANPFISTDEGIVIRGAGEEVSLIKDATDKTILFTGGTSANFDYYTNVRKLRSMGNTSRTQGNFVFWDYFTAPTEEELSQHLLPAYDNPAQKARFENGLEMLGLSLEDFSFYVEYVKDPQDGIMEHGKRVFPGKIQAGFKAKKDVQLSLSDGRMIEIKAGSFYPLNTSKRRSEAEVKGLFKEADVKKIDEFSELGMKLAVLKFPPTKLTQHISKIRNALLIALAFGAGLAGKGMYDMKVQKDKEQQAYEWVMHTSENQEKLQQKADHLWSFLSTMYRIPTSREKEVKLLLLQYLTEHSGTTEEYEYLQKFVRANTLLLANYGVDTQHPYADLAKHLSDFQKTLALQEDIDLGEFVNNQPVHPNDLPSPQEILMKYGRNSPEFEQAIQERQEAAAASDNWQKQHYQLQPVASMDSYIASNGVKYKFVLLRNGYILASSTQDGRDEYLTDYSSVTAKKAIQDYLENFGGENYEKSEENAFLAQK